MLVAGISPGHEIGLAVVAAVFIVFALTCSFVVPRYRPDFPGRNGMSVFVIAALVVFAGMISAVTFFGREAEAKGAEKAAQQATSQNTIQVQEKEFAIVLPPQKTVAAGRYTFVVHNVGKIPHDLAVSGPGATAASKTPLISPGSSADLTVTLSAGSYTLWCTVPGHRAAGMVAKLSVG